MDRTLKIDKKAFYLFLGLILVSGVFVIAGYRTTDLNFMGNDITNVTDVNATNLNSTGVLNATYGTILHLNMDNHNITDVECIVFNSGGAICTG